MKNIERRFVAAVALVAALSTVAPAQTSIINQVNTTFGVGRHHWGSDQFNSTVSLAGVPAGSLSTGLEVPGISGNIVRRSGWYYRFHGDSQESQFVVENSSNTFGPSYSGRLYDSSLSQSIDLTVSTDGISTLANANVTSGPPYAAFGFSIYWYVEVNVGGTAGSTSSIANGYVGPNGETTYSRHYHLIGQDAARHEALVLGIGATRSAMGTPAQMMGALQDTSISDFATGSPMNGGPAGDYAFVFQYDFNVGPGAHRITNFHIPTYLGLARSGEPIPVPEPAGALALGAALLLVRKKSR